MRPKRLISLLVAVCMMITMLPLSAVTAFATDTSTVHEANDDEGIYRYAYKKNEDGETVTITKFLGPVDPTNNGPYVITIPTTLDKYTVTGIGKWAFDRCGLHTLTIEGPIESMGLAAFYECTKLETISFGENIKTIGEQAFQGCSSLTKVTIPDSVTSIGEEAFYECTKLETISFGENIETIGRWAFTGCSALTNVTIPKNVTTIESGTFKKCSKLEYIILPAGLTSFKDSLTGCPAGNPNGAIYYKNYKAAADALLADNDNNSNIDANDKLKNRNFLYLCKVTFDANGGDQTDYPEMSVYKTKKINANDLAAIKAPTRAGYNFTGWYTDTDGKQLFNADETAITDDITLHAGWKFDPDAPGCHPLTVTGGTVTVKYDGSDVTSKLNSNTDETTGQKTYDVPDGAEVTVTLDKTLIPKGKVFDGWSTTGNLSLLTGQNSKAETITFTMNSDAKVSAKYRDAAADHTPDTAVCHPLTLKDGVITSVTVPGKDGADPEDITEIVKKNANEDGSFNVPEGATVSVAFDKDAFADSGLKFGHWDITGLDDPNAYQDKESFDFEMPAKAVTLKAMTQDASIEDDEPDIVGPIVIGTTVVVGGAVLGYQAYSLGAEFAGKLMALPYFPSNRSALAMMLWEDAGKPMPESELLYPDVEQEERDMDLQHAARWAMENELIPDLNDEGTAPEEMKFFPANPVSKLDVLNAWQKAQELKQNA